jgi:DNA-3-methyladenine glycosylase II
MKSLDSSLFLKARKHLSMTDPVMKVQIQRFPSFSYRTDSITSPFEALVRAVASQQLHGAAAEAILRRFTALVPDTRFPGPDDVDELTDDQLRSAGFTIGYVRMPR